MTKNIRVFASAWPGSTLSLLSLGLVLLAVACGDNTKSAGGPASGGASAGGVSKGGGSNESGAPGAAGAVSGGAVGTSGGAGGAGNVAGAGGANVGGAGNVGGASSGGAASNAGSPGRGGSSGAAGALAGGGSSGAAAGGSSGTGRSAGCGKTATLTFGTVPGEPPNGTGTGGYVTIQSSGQSRGFAMRLPDNYDKNQPYWLIFGFHWNGGMSKDVDSGGSNGYTMSHFGLQKLSKNNAIFVAPQGLGNGWPNSGGQDLKFVDDMVKLIEDNYCVDTTHLFANGFSYGGGMSYAIACARAKVFRGVAIYDGAVLSGCDGGNDPVAYWQMGGLTDNTCTIAAGRAMRDKFVKNNGCTAQSPPEPAQPPPYLATGGHLCTTYSGCSAGHPLRWCAHQSGHGNAIVDGTADLYNSCATPPKSCSATCPCSWVPDDVWSFFTAL